MNRTYHADNKRTARKKSYRQTQKKSRGGTIIGLFIGLVVGVVGAALIVWFVQKTPPPFVDKTPPAASSGASTGTQEPMALPGKPGDLAIQNSDKPRFDFYTILPGKSDGSSEVAPDPKGDAPANVDSRRTADKPETAASEPIYIQVGSFQSDKDADNLKAKLAMMGIQAAVSQAMLQDKVWYRVRLGPYKKSEDAAAIRVDLTKQGISSTLVKKD